MREQWCVSVCVVHFTLVLFVYVAIIRLLAATSVVPGLGANKGTHTYTDYPDMCCCIAILDEERLFFSAVRWLMWLKRPQ